MVPKVSNIGPQFRLPLQPKTVLPRLTPEMALRERLSLALRHAMPEYAQQGAWVAFIAKNTGVSGRRIERHMIREHKCSGEDLLAYFDYFGPDFEQQVRAK